MRLAELARRQPFAKPPTVPDWTLGCFRRRCITYATGREDAETTVIWVQSHGLTGDIRIPATRRMPQAARLADCSAQDLVALAKGEGFVAETSWKDGHMSWDAFAAFQPYDKWPEPGRLERVGACLIEWAPSGVYVEDWRMQPGSSGLSVGLRLVSETVGGVEQPREGALVIAGDHAIQVIGRRTALPSSRAYELISPANAAAVFDCQVAYAIRQGDDYEIALAVDPFTQGGRLFTDAFEPAGAGELVQHDGEIRRRWRIDTLLADQERTASTPARQSGLDWLAGESETLLA